MTMGGWAGGKYLAAQAEEVPGSASRLRRVWRPGLSWLVLSLEEKKREAAVMLHTHTAEAERSWGWAAGIKQGLLDLNAAPQLLQTSLPLSGFTLSNTQTP